MPNVHIAGTCKIVETYEEDADRVHAECLAHGWSASGSESKVYDKLDAHVEQYNPKEW